MNAMISDQPVCISTGELTPAAAEEMAVAWLAAFPPKTKHAPTSTTNATDLIAAVASCTLLPQRTPLYCSRKNTTITLTAIARTCPVNAGKSAPLYSPITIDTAADVPHDDSQSLQPTMNPG